MGAWGRSQSESGYCQGDARTDHSDGQLVKLVSAARHLQSCLDVCRRSKWYNCLTYHSKQVLPLAWGSRRCGFTANGRARTKGVWNGSGGGQPRKVVESDRWKNGCFLSDLVVKCDSPSTLSLSTDGHVGNGILIMILVPILIVIPRDVRDPIPTKSSQLSLQGHMNSYFCHFSYLDFLIITNSINKPCMTAINKCSTFVQRNLPFTCREFFSL